MTMMKEFRDGRTGHPLLKELKQYLYAHRGLYQKPDVPENSMAAFRQAVAHGFGAELDVHLTADGKLVVIHDSDTERVTGVRSVVENATRDELKQLRLEGTDETIPDFDAVLDLFENKLPLIIELKVNKNRKKLAKAVCERMKEYKGLFCIESFDPLVMQEVRKLAPELVRGQLSENFAKNKETISKLLGSQLTALRLNRFSKPDFIAYRYEDRTHRKLQDALKKGIQEVSWTIRSQADLDQTLALGSIPIFENFIPESLTVGKLTD